MRPINKKFWPVSFCFKMGLLLFHGFSLSCLSPSSSICGDFVCPRGKECSPNKDICILPEQSSACKGIKDSTKCSYHGQSFGLCLNQVCVPAGCGNGVIESGEMCDDNNRIQGDGCSSDCTSTEVCGNGIVDAHLGESCDDTTPTCKSNCITASCGDNIIDNEFFERCDDGILNSDTSDANCRTNCQIRRCGDGIVDKDAGENCDDGNPLPGDGCSASCLTEVCGNSIVDIQSVEDGFIPLEQCDDGDNKMNNDGCSALCLREEAQWRKKNFWPSSRNSYGYAYDAIRGKVIIFGGWGDNNTLLNDTWEWDGDSWNQRMPSVSPSPRSGHAMAFDKARGKIVLFGGNKLGESLRDTWEWDGNNWANVTNDIAPSARRNHKMAYDAVHAKIILFGGTATEDLNDTWEWNGSKWTKLIVSNPPSARHSHTMAYDPTSGKLLLFGGWSGRYLQDTWLWDGIHWTQHVDISPPPPSRSHHAMTSMGDGTIVLHGGSNGDFLSDTWEWDGSTWKVINSIVAPSARGAHGIIYDAMQNKVILFGGYNGDYLSDTWILQERQWTQEQLLDPPHRVSTSLSYDSSRGKTLFFGGRGVNATTLDDMWESNGSRFKLLTPPQSPPGRYGHVSVYIGYGKTLLHGGVGNIGTLNDTWLWDGNTWTEIVTPGPPLRVSFSMAYDSNRERVVLFGGVVDANGSRQRASDTWEWDSENNWQKIEVNVAPSPRNRHWMVYDSQRKTVVLTGGYGENDHRFHWEWNGKEWRQGGNNPPLFRSGEGMAAYDSKIGTIVTMGGKWLGEVMRDTWTLQDHQWKKIKNLGVSIQKRFLHAMAYDAVHSNVVLFGGAFSKDNQLYFLNDVWTFNHTSGVKESCITGFDGDGDTLIGCADPDCWGRCYPDCPPVSTEDWPNDCDLTKPHCGDGECNLELENGHLCPQDCAPRSICGDFICVGLESSSNCPGDCGL